jgi:hypothetical protein
MLTNLCIYVIRLIQKHLLKSQGVIRFMTFNIYLAIFHVKSYLIRGTLIWKIQLPDVLYFCLPKCVH